MADIIRAGDDTDEEKTFCCGNRWILWSILEM